jgi:hypothetical protein
MSQGRAENTYNILIEKYQTKKLLEATSLHGMMTLIFIFITWTGFVSLRIGSNEGPL